MAFVYLQNGRPDKASILYLALDSLTPGDRHTLRSLAVAQLKNGTPEIALATLDRLAMAGGIDMTFHLLRAKALVALGRTEESNVAIGNYLDMRTDNLSAPQAGSILMARM